MPRLSIPELKKHAYPIEKWSVLIAALITLALHGLIYLFFPWKVGSITVAHSQDNEIVYASETPPEKTRKRFVETNPDLPSNEPDTAENFAARSQQAAQASPSNHPLSTTPFIDGNSETSHKVVSGDTSEESPQRALPSPKAQEKTASSALPIAPPVPPQPDFIRQENPKGDDLDSLLSQGPDDPAQKQKTIQHVPLNIHPPITHNQAQTPSPSTIAHPNNGPRARPRVAPDVLAGEVMRSIGQMPVRGNALNAKFNDYGEYLQQMYEIIGLQWFALNRNARIIRDEIASLVVIEFAINRYGAVTHLEVKHTTAGPLATLLCQDAIRSRAPFGDWTDDMIATLKQEESIAFYFHYR